jgi:hypothetical protein
MPQYVIWSEEHGAWWGREETNFNYTRSLEKARRFSKEQADEIVHDANAFLEVGEWHEVAIPDPLAKPPAPTRSDDENQFEA